MIQTVSRGFKVPESGLLCAIVVIALGFSGACWRAAAPRRRCIRARRLVRRSCRTACICATRGGS